MSTIYFAGCSDKSSDTDTSNNEDRIPTEEVLGNICIDWFSTADNVRQCMKGYHEHNNSTTDFIEYSNNSESINFAYRFKDSELISSVAIIPLASEIDQSDVLNKFNLSTYIYMGIVDGAKVYVNDTNNTMATVMTRTFDEISYLTIGFTPINAQGKIEYAEPIEVSTLTPTEITTKSMTLNASYSGIDQKPSAYFKYSTSQSMEDAKNVSATISGNTFSKTISNLKINTTYYIQAYIKYDDLVYEGEILSSSVTPMKTYTVGDYYPDYDSREGVVYKTTNDGANGVIISLDQSYLQWDTEGLFCTDFNASNSYDGAKNNIGTNLPLAKWIKGHGKDWFAPAKYQLDITISNLRKVNESLLKVNAPEMNGFYWTSTEYTSNKAYVSTVTEYGYMGYENGYVFYNSKDQNRSTRAMKHF